MEEGCMAHQPYRFLHVSVRVFKVFAWVSLALQIIGGLILIVSGGEPLFLGGVEVPARVAGLLNFVSAALYFYLFWLVSHLIRLVLDIRMALPDSPRG
jgi:hypothetical protein